MFVAPALTTIIGEMNNVTRGMAVAQHDPQGMVKQIGGIDVDLQHTGERVSIERHRVFLQAMRWRYG